MNLLFDLTVCQPSRNVKFHGGGVYGYVLLKALLCCDKRRIVVYYDSLSYIDESVAAILSSESVTLVDCNKVNMIECIEAYDVSVIYSPLYKPEYKDVLNSCKKSTKFVVTVHGLRNQEMNRDIFERYYASTLKSYFKALIKQTPYYSRLTRKYHDRLEWLFMDERVHVVTVSNHSRNSIAYYYPHAKPEVIDVFYSPSTNVTDWQNTEAYDSDHEYYLIVSSGRWIKNSYRAIKAFENLFERGKLNNKRVIIVGLSKNTFVYKSINDKTRFEFLDYVDRHTLESLYKGAYALVYPSLNEGFGYPPLEAMKYGVPVIASGIASIPEVCGESVVLVNPYSIDEIGIRILQLEDPIFHEQMKRQSVNRYQLIEKKQESDLKEFSKKLIRMCTI